MNASRKKFPVVFHAALCVLAAPVMLCAETVSVNYVGEVDLAPFHCTDVSQGGRISRICYDGAQRYLLVRLKELYHHFCEIEAGTVERFIASYSIDHFFKVIIENRHNCRPATVPKYEQRPQPQPALAAPPSRSPSPVPDEGLTVVDD